MLEAAVTDVIGSQIDLKALRQTGGIGMLGYLYRDQAGRDGLAAKVKAHPGTKRAVAFLDKVVLLSPRGQRAYAALYELHRFTRDDAALKALEERARAGNLDTSDEVAHAREALTGAKDAEQQVALAAALKRAGERVNALRAAGGPTAAVALTQQADVILGLDVQNGSGDLGAAIALAEEAHHIAPSAATASTLHAAYVYRAAKDVRRDDSGFDTLCKKCERSANPVDLAAVALGKPGSAREKLLRHPDFQKSMALTRDEETRYADGPGLHEWAMASAADPALAGRMADVIRKAPRRQLYRSIEALLHPSSVPGALEAYWLGQIVGEPDAGKAALRRVAELGIPVPVEP